MRGYFGIGIYKPKTETNVGTLWRSAFNMGANFIFVISAKYKRQPSDTVKAYQHVPFYEYSTWEDFTKHVPYNCKIVCAEIDSKARDLKFYTHPERAVYVLGAEDNGIPQEYLKDNEVIQINNCKFCLNVSVAGSIILYDRIYKYPERKVSFL